MNDIIIQVIIFSGLMFGLIIIFQVLDLNSPSEEKILLGSATIEAMESGMVGSNERVGPNPDLAINMSEFDGQNKPEHSFCEYNGGDLNNLESECNRLTKKNCSIVKCCGYLNDEKCVNGNEFGPTFRSDKNNGTIEIDTYYYMNKCSGPKCDKTQ
jgi:hypothetical protein